MAQIVYSENALANFERVFDFLVERDPQAAVGAASAICEAIDTLSNHPLIGRTIVGELRELVISYGKTGYIALYRYTASCLCRIKYVSWPYDVNVSWIIRFNPPERSDSPEADMNSVPFKISGHLKTRKDIVAYLNAALDDGEPVDLTPMRAWDRHDLVSALPFYIDEKQHLGYSVARVGESFGLTRAVASDILRELLKATKDYPERVLALKDAPDVNRKNWQPGENISRQADWKGG